MDYLMAQFGMQRVNKKGIGEDLILVYQKTDQIVAAKKDLKTQDAIKKYFENKIGISIYKLLPNIIESIFY